MEKPDYSIIKKYSVGILYIIYLVGIVGHVVPQGVELMKVLTPFTLFLTGGIVIYNVMIKGSGILTWLIITFILTFIIEVIGVKTGVIFGNYYYGDTLGIKFLSVPLIISLNWIVLILGAKLISFNISKDKWISSILCGLFALLFDLFMEPVAITLNYWNWTGGDIPIQNYIAWFIIAFLFSLLYSSLNVKAESKIPVHFFLIQFVFFIILNFFM